MDVSYNKWHAIIVSFFFLLLHKIMVWLTFSGILDLMKYNNLYVLGLL
jgi:hypothetical protein